VKKTKRRLQILVLAFLLFHFNPISIIDSTDSIHLLNQLNQDNQINRMNSINLVNLSAWAQSSENQHGTRSVEIPTNYVIGLGDVLEIFVWRNEQLSREVVVRPDGKISLPLIQDAQAEGLTVVELRDQITRRLGEHLNHPTVTIIVRQINSYKVSVLGRVVRPGVYPITGNTTLIEAISAAGGFTEWANKRKITVITHQAGEEKKITVNYNKIASGKDPSQNIILKRGDTIIVP
jgi:polysaccharide export outer membrane protein